MGPLRAGKGRAGHGQGAALRPGPGRDPGALGRPRPSASTANVHGLDVLPAPYPPTKVDIKGDWRVDALSLTVFSTARLGGRPILQGHEHPAGADVPGAGDQRSPAGRDHRALPRRARLDRRRLHDLATDVTAGAATPYEKAVKLQDWFTQSGKFTYSLDAPAAAPDGALRDFLFTSRTGYCEQFAAVDGAARPAPRHPGARRHGLHGGHPADGRRLGGTDQGRPRVAGAVLHRGRLAAVRADARRRRRPGQRDRALLHRRPQLLPGSPGSEFGEPAVGRRGGRTPAPRPAPRPIPRHRTDTARRPARRARRR